MQFRFDLFRLVSISFRFGKFRFVSMNFVSFRILQVPKKIMFFFKCKMLLKKRMRVRTPIESPIIFFYWKYAPFFHILNDDMYMMLSVCCFWIFNKKKRCVKSWVTFFNKNYFFPSPMPGYESHLPWSGFIKAVNFKIFFFNYNG